MLHTERHLADLPNEVLGRIARMSYDILLEKHEAFPYCFSGDPTALLRDEGTDLVRIGSDDVLLPTYPDNREHTSVLHAYTSPDRAHLTVVVQDLWWRHEYPDMSDYDLPCYFVALCECVAEGVYVAVFYHETTHPYATAEAGPEAQARGRGPPRSGEREQPRWRSACAGSACHSSQAHQPARMSHAASTGAAHAG